MNKLHSQRTIRQPDLLEMVTEDFEILPGAPLPMGVTLERGRVNFSLFSRNATEVCLCLFRAGAATPFLELPLEPTFHRTGDIWHVAIRGLKEEFCYGYRLNREPNDNPYVHTYDPKHILIDPHARQLWGGETWGRSNHDGKPFRLARLTESNYDWEHVAPPNRHLADTIIYELHVRGYTRHFSSGVASPGTFAGLIEKIPYLQDLGVTAVELLPVTDFDEDEIVFRNPWTGKRLRNFWGYHPVSFYAPKSAYAADPEEVIREFKDMVKAFHRAGIEVILDFVFNHTGEGDQRGPMFSFKGIDNSVYYMVDPLTGAYKNYSGTGNTMNCNHPVMRDLILDVLRYWVTEMYIDGFRFDLASILGRGRNGEVLSNPPLIERIAEDPILANTKLIAEAWDAAGLYQVGSFPNWGRWAEWNGKFRDDVRRFLRGDTGLLGTIATRLTGSSDLYEAGGRAPFHSVNLITCHDGFTLKDLVSYNEKHNEANGEKNRDGTQDNASFNYGVEGPTKDPGILATRLQQRKNAAAFLFLSQGVPLVLGGDEFGRTQGGNNNAYCQDNEVSWVDWRLLDEERELHDFFRMLIHYRRQSRLLGVRLYPSSNSGDEIQVFWHGLKPMTPDWSEEAKTLGMQLRRRECDEELLILINMNEEEATFELPTNRQDTPWKRVFDTHIPVAEGAAVTEATYVAKPRTVVLLEFRGQG